MSDGEPPSAEIAFALMLETACGDFETLQDLIRGDIQLVSGSKGEQDLASRARTIRAKGKVQMALAKSFVFNAVRAHRICTSRAGSLTLDRLERKRFVKATEPLIGVRHVNEHGFDGDSTKPSMHVQEGGQLDETSLVIDGPDKILMGPLNLATIYTSVDRMRKLAGFSALSDESRKARSAARVAAERK
jgi:hypothetical protein